MDKGKLVIIGMVGLALATSVGFIMGYETGRPAPADQPTLPRPGEVEPAPPAPPAAAPIDSPAPPAPPTPGATRPGELSADAARRAAIAFLKGDPYGRTDAEVSGNIVDQRLVRSNGDVQWQFDVKTAPTSDYPDGIEGQLILDGRTGAMVQAGLPFLD